MANICTGRFFFFGKRQDVLDLLLAGATTHQSYNLSQNASRIAKMTGDMHAPDKELLTQLKGWMLTSSKDFGQLHSDESSLNWTTYNKDVSTRCIFNPNELTDDDRTFFQNWMGQQSQQRRDTLRKQDFTQLVNNTEKTQIPTNQLTVQDILEQINTLEVAFLPMLDAPRLSRVNDWDLSCAINREVLGNRSDLYRENPNIWIEYEEDYVLFAVTSDYKWWCAVDGTQPVSVMFPDVLVGVAYLEEQGIFGQRLYHNGKELLKTVGPSGTLPDHCTEWVNEYGEEYCRLKWEYTMDWQSDFVKEAIFKHVKISPTPMNNTQSEDDNA